MFSILVCVIVAWLSTIFVINLNRRVIAISDRHTYKIFFKQDKFFFKLPYPFQKIDQIISLEPVSINRYIQVGGIDFDFSCQYKVVDAQVAYCKLNEFEEYFLELITNFIIQTFESDIEPIEDKEVYVRNKITTTLSRYGIEVINFQFN